MNNSDSVTVTKTKTEEIQKLLDKLRSEDAEIAGLIVYNFETDEILGSTYDPKKSKSIIALRKKYAQLGTEAVMEGVYPPGRWNWGLTSVARHTLFATNLVGDYTMAGEFVESKAASACAEDALEFSLMINDILVNAGADKD